MANFKIEHDRPNCIGCGACASVAPAFWKMSDTDGKSDVIDGKATKNGEEIILEERELEELGPNKEAAEVCPVNVIHLIDLQKKEKII